MIHDVPGFPVAGKNRDLRFEFRRIVESSKTHGHIICRPAVASQYLASALGTEGFGNAVAVVCVQCVFGHPALQLEILHGKHRAGGMAGATQALAICTMAMRNDNRRAGCLVADGTAMTSSCMYLYNRFVHTITRSDSCDQGKCNVCRKVSGMLLLSLQRGTTNTGFGIRHKGHPDFAMATSNNKTTPSKAGVEAFLGSVEHDTRRADGFALFELFNRVTSLKPKMWGPSIVGYGRYHYKYESGREGDFLITGFSPRKSALSIYIMPGYRDMSEKLERLGKHRIGKSCLYISKLADIDLNVLEEIVLDGIAYMKTRYDVFDE